MSLASLYIVATPIGNMEDITLRALRVLREVDAIVCEDTRVTGKLLHKYGITTRMLAYHAQSSAAQAKRILDLVEEGKNLALVSDSGTPTISDPGVVLVAQVRRRFSDTVAIIPVPGANAAAAALSVSGLPASEFLFLGFLPHKKGRETLFKEIAASHRTVVFYESPHRIVKTLERLTELLEPGRTVVVARELTKLHEEIVSGNATEVLAAITQGATSTRGEFVVVVAAT